MKRLLLLAAAVCLLPLAFVAEAPAGPRVRDHGEARGSRLRPCCDSISEDRTRSPERIEMRNHYLFAPSVVDARRARSEFSDRAPAGREIPDVDDPGAENVEPGGGAPAAVAPAIRNRFRGLDIDTAGHEGSHGFPADTNVAVGPSRVIEVSNIGIRLTDRSGGSASIRSLNSFFGVTSPTFLFDPKVYYDPIDERFFLVAIRQQDSPRRSFIHVAVSRGPDPQSLSAPEDFCSYRIRGKRQGSWADFPSIGANEHWFAVSVNNFRFADGGFNRVFLYALNKVRLVQNENACPSAQVFRFGITGDALGQIAFTVNPAEHMTRNGLPGTPLFLMSSQPFTSNIYTVYRLTGEIGRRPTLTKEALAGTVFDISPSAPQVGGDLVDTGDPRIGQVVYRNGVLTAAHGTVCSIGAAPNESCVRVLDVETAANSVSLLTEDTFGRANRFFFMPGVAVGNSGDTVAVFQQLKRNGRIGVSFNGRRAGRESFDAVRLLRRGGCPRDNFDPGIELQRTGDYVGAAADPTSNDLWIAGEYAASVPGFGCSWSTQIARVGY